MGLLEITSQDSKRVLGAGTHTVTIAGIAKALSKKGTKQLKFTYESEDGVIDIYHNIEGYEKNADGSYVMDAKGQRKRSKENTAKALKILGKLANHCGIEKGQTLDVADLIGKEVRIVIEMEVATQGAREGEEFARFQYSLPANVEKETEYADNDTF